MFKHQCAHKDTGLCQDCFKYESEIADLRAQNEELRKDIEEWRVAELTLSAAYLRIRGKLDAFDTPKGPTAQQVYQHTEDKLDQLRAQCEKLKKENERLQKGPCGYCEDSCREIDALALMVKEKDEVLRKIATPNVEEDGKITRSSDGWLAHKALTLTQPRAQKKIEDMEGVVQAARDIDERERFAEEKLNVISGGFEYKRLRDALTKLDSRPTKEE